MKNSANCVRYLKHRITRNLFGFSSAVFTASDPIRGNKTRFAFVNEGLHESD